VSPSNTVSLGSRPTSVPSGRGILIYPTVWPQYTNITEKTGQDNGPVAQKELLLVTVASKHKTLTLTNDLVSSCLHPSPEGMGVATITPVL